MKQNNNEMVGIIKEDTRKEKKRYPASLSNLGISYVALVIAVKERKRNSSRLEEEQRTFPYAEIRDTPLPPKMVSRQMGVKYI